ncbi:hypothetical protein IU500_35240 [Nocardia terpenica]|nr:hypothetical protein [Nocardia terpenica]MBF6066171.1 hypothetical protein [Nocardia terpenica]MBF6109271.1 hypothetical protein [Nocardia terpenica]MBF6116423.1 hypothetical protein [Nocardia terpenica]MBF6123572.1 hypothetical protein [Nocardia terpenica]MBF6156856.1 hypothetical protein [Nocardia terpenica]
MYGTYFGTIGQDVLSIAQSFIQLISDIIGMGSGGGGGGAYPPGQYPLG